MTGQPQAWTPVSDGTWTLPQKGVVWHGPGQDQLTPLIGAPFPGERFVLPVMTLADEALENNIMTMARWAKSVGAVLAPHAKTTMSPQLIARQLDAGAWALTAATISQVMVLRAIGIERILLANELVDPVGIRWVANALRADPDFDFYCYVDSPEGVELLERTLRADPPPRPVNVLLELGHRGGRTGCRSVETALSLVDLVSDKPHLQLAGIAGYEGSVGHDDTDATVASVRRYLADIVALARQVQHRGMVDGRVIVSAGGSAYFDVVAEECRFAGIPDALCVLRSGAYITHDDGFYGTVTPHARGVAGTPEFVPALRLWAHVLSRPEPGLAIVGAGRRDVPFDEGLPTVLRVYSDDRPELPADGFQFERLNDQHAFVRIPKTSALRPGDVVCCGISHPCTAFDKWRLLPIVRDGVVVDVAQTAF